MARTPLFRYLRRTLALARVAGEGSDLKSNVNDIKEVRKINDHVVEIETKAPFPILPNAIALNSIQFHLSGVIGPVLAGVALASVGIAACFGLNALWHSTLGLWSAFRRA